jgi:hypothetical protein
VIGALTGITKDLGLRFNVVSLLPAGALGLFVFGLLASGAPEHAPDIHRLSKRVASLDAWQAGAAFLALIAFALVTQPLQLSLVRLLEGYWGESRLGRVLAAPGRALARRRRRALESDTKSAGPGEPSPQQAETMVAASRRLERSFPPENELLPTQLGNVLRAGETRAGGRYGLLTVVAWPRLYPLLPTSTAAIVDDQRDQLDLAARFCAFCLLGAAVSLGLLATHGTWLVVPAAALVLAWICYRAAIAAALQYAVGLETAFDLHRVELLRALHLRLPADYDSELKTNEALSTFLLQGPSFARLDYEYGGGGT